MPSAKKIAVAGATGRVGHHVTDVLAGRGHDVVPMSRSQGVDVITGDGLAAALTGVEAKRRRACRGRRGVHVTVAWPQARSGTGGVPG